MCAYFCIVDRVAAQSCPAGIPSNGNPMCIPPDRPDSPYYNGSGAYVQQPAQPQTILIKRHWADRWGAIAGDANAGALGFVTGYKSKNLAEEAALQQCLNDGGDGCKLVGAFFNQCAAFVIGANGGYSASAPDIKQAGNVAMQDCSAKKDKKCRIYKTACSMSAIETE